MADERRLGTHQRHGLLLHVRTHERAVSIVIFQEGNERGRDGHELFGADVHQRDYVTRRHQEFACLTAGNDFLHKDRKSPLLKSSNKFQTTMPSSALKKKI